MMRHCFGRSLLVMGVLSATGNLMADTSSLDSQVKILANAYGLTGNPFQKRNTPSINSPMAQLGKDLFFSKSLGGDQDSACVSCHHPLLGGGDDLSLPIGVGAITPDLLGPGRAHSVLASKFDGGPPVPRNAPTTFNLAGWDSVLFHDGRLESLGKTPNANGSDGRGIRTPDSAFSNADRSAGENLAQAQARFPVTSKEEMKGFNYEDKNNQAIRDFLAQRLQNSPDAGHWLTKFQNAFDRPNDSASTLINEQTISFAVGEYERSQVFVNTPWRQYLEGNSQAISESAKQGALLFYRPTSQGGAGCVSCHSGDFFTDEKFHNIGMIQIGRGKGDGDGSEDFGRFRETKNPLDKYAFRTPSLLNVAKTGPWSHAGAYMSLEGVIKHHLNPQLALDTYDVAQLKQAGIQNLGVMRTNTRAAIDNPNLAVRNLAVSDREVGYLVDFLNTLTDPCVTSETCLSPWIANSNDDSGQVKAIDGNGNSLNRAGSNPLASTTSTTGGNTGNTLQPVPLAPIGNINTTTPTFSWKAASNAKQYLLWVNEYAIPNVPGKINRIYTPEEAGCSTGGTCQVSPPATFARADGEWWVTAIAADGARTESEGAYFHIQ